MVTHISPEFIQTDAPPSNVNLDLVATCSNSTFNDVEHHVRILCQGLRRPRFEWNVSDAEDIFLLRIETQVFLCHPLVELMEDTAINYGSVEEFLLRSRHAQIRDQRPNLRMI